MDWNPALLPWAILSVQLTWQIVVLVKCKGMDLMTNCTNTIIHPILLFSSLATHSGPMARTHRDKFFEWNFTSEKQESCAGVSKKKSVGTGYHQIIKPRLEIAYKNSVEKLANRKNHLNFQPIFLSKNLEMWDAVSSQGMRETYSYVLTEMLLKPTFSDSTDLKT